MRTSLLSFATCLILLAQTSQAERWIVQNSAAQKAALADQDGLRILRRFELIPWTTVEATAQQMEAMLKAGKIQSYQPDYILKPVGVPLLIAAGAAVLTASCGGDDEKEPDPNGPAQTSAWGIQKIRAEQAHAQNKGKGVKVAVIDSGIDAEHPDLKVVKGKNFILNSPAPGAVEWDDCNSHGTHVAAIIGARDNGIGVLGVAPEVDLYAARVFDCEGAQGFLTNIIAAIEWGVSENVDVINLSLGSSIGSLAELAAVNAARDAGIIVVAASGNDSAPGDPKPLLFPAAYPAVVAVGATDPSDKIASFSNQGPNLAVSAPGVAILSAVPVGSAAVSTLRQNSKLYDSLPLAYSGLGTVEGVLVDCGLALAPGDCPTNVKDNIALVLRGQNLFSDKVTQVMRAGAKAAIIYNHTEDGGGVFNGTLQDPGTGWIPVVALSNASGLDLKALSNARATIEVKSYDYGVFDGTSQASPHVAGLAALLIGSKPSLNQDQIKTALMQGAIDLGQTGKDHTFGAGRIDAPNAIGAASTTSHNNPPSQEKQSSPLIISRHQANLLPR